MATIVVSGSLATKLQNGGEPWVRLSWIFGLRQLGFDVHFVEHVQPAACVDAAGCPAALSESATLSRFRDITREFDLTDSATLVYGSGSQTWGLPLPELLDLVADSALLINIAGNLEHEGIRRRARRRIFIDEDPGFSQIWHASGISHMLEGYGAYFTVGLNIGTPRCALPTEGIEWKPLFQPVVLQQWPVRAAGDAGRFTTIGTWRGPYGPVTWEGKTYGVKAHQFRRFAELPRRARHQFELAIDIHPDDDSDRRRLEDNGWSLVDPAIAAGTPAAFRKYVQASGAEFSVAQGIYVEANTGWFSDRTVRYLASGKPVLVQDTGFSAVLPTGLGLVAFTSLDDAVAGADSIMEDYAEHCRAARAIAEEFFDSRTALASIAEEAHRRPDSRLERFPAQQ